MINTRVLTTPPTKYERRTGTNNLSSKTSERGSEV